MFKAKLAYSKAEMEWWKDLAEKAAHPVVARKQKEEGGGESTPPDHTFSDSTPSKVHLLIVQLATKLISDEYSTR